VIPRKRQGYSPVVPGVGLADALERMLKAYPKTNTRAQIDAWNAAQVALAVWRVSLRNPAVIRDASLKKPED
jgi:hypothetical protein